MKPTPDHIEDGQMIDLLNQLLPADQAHEIFAHMKGCSDCELRFVRLARHHETLKARPLPHVSADGHVVMGEDARTAPRRRRIRVAGAVGAAAAIVVALVVVVPRMLPRPAGDTTVYWMPTEDDERTIRAREDVTSLRRLAQGVEAYREHDLENATTALESIEFGALRQEFESIRRLYLASAYVNERRYHSAIDLLPEWSMNRFPMPWRQRARWVAYLANRGLGNDEAAAQLLDILVEADGDIGQRARDERARLGDG